MIAYKNFTFVHVPKTAGAFVRRLFDEVHRLKLIPDSERKIPWHTGLSDERIINTAYITLRDPVSWYESWINYWNWRGFDSFHEVLSKGRTLSPDKIAENMLAPSQEIIESINDLMIATNCKVDAAHYTFSYATPFEWSKTGEGFYTFLLKRMLVRNWTDHIAFDYPADLSDIKILTTANVVNDFINMLEENGIDVPYKASAAIRNVSPHNTAESHGYNHITLSREIQDRIVEKEQLPLEWLKYGMR